MGNWKWVASYTDNPLGSTNPITPQNSDSSETLILLDNNTWKYFVKNIAVDSGTYTIGHGSYLPAKGVTKYVYDSIVYYRNSIKIDWNAYEIHQNDTLVMSKDFAGTVGSGSKWWVKD